MTTIIFVHGYSVTNLNTYRELPLRLQAEAAQNGLQNDVKQIFLGRYISFQDEVGLTLNEELETSKEEIEATNGELT